MGSQRIQYLVEHLWKDTPTSKILRSNLEALALEAGIEGPFLQSDANIARPWLITESWIRETWGFMSDNGITIESDTAKLSHKRTADQGFMNGFARANIPKAHLRKLNLCRLYLQITHLSDIRPGDGLRINSQFTGT